ncbi:MAG TPA: response regulator [Thermoanaerobaculia bacterium]|jgi:CheY-like chemotaxis protein
MAHRHSVLVVEDDDDLREAFVSVLLDEDFRIEEARNGNEALDRLRAGQRPCLILLDLSMPVMNGWEFLARQRRDPAIASIPAVVISATVDEDDFLSPTAVLRKPVDYDQLLRAVNRHLQAEEVRYGARPLPANN